LARLLLRAPGHRSPERVALLGGFRSRLLLCNYRPRMLVLGRRDRPARKRFPGHFSGLRWQWLSRRNSRREPRGISELAPPALVSSHRLRPLSELALPA